MNREDAQRILEKYMTGERYLKHSYAVEAIMRELAKKLAPEHIELWGIVGLLHDLDEEQCDWENHMEVHGPTSVELLKQEGIDEPELFDAICAHNPKSGVKATTVLQLAIYAADPMSGFINAIALVYQDQKIASVKVKSILKRLPELRFAAGANRTAMQAITRTGMEMDEFAQIALTSMTEIAEILGL